jgi:hypothetical protein
MGWPEGSFVGTKLSPLPRSRTFDAPNHVDSRDKPGHDALKLVRRSPHGPDSDDQRLTRQEPRRSSPTTERPESTYSDITNRRWTRENPALQMVAQRKDSARSGPTPAPRAAPAPRRSQASPASAKSLRARARGQRGLRRDGRSIDKAWRALATRAARRFGRPVASR